MIGLEFLYSFILFLVGGRLEGFAVKFDDLMGKLHNCFVVSGCFDKFASNIMSKINNLTRELQKKKVDFCIYVMIIKQAPLFL